ncbi:MAG: indole-3-glycerol phosphate synthase TrpC [Actinobacteria bacterium]|nr:indole-3-glycerol phosphate synthase TrpC [Actinomycetota bacterium]
MATYLDEILAAHRARAADDPRLVGHLIERAQGLPAPRPFAAALAAPGLAVIAEIKRRSPSKGALAPDLVPGVLAKHYAEGGAAALSVLTDEQFFGGSTDDLGEARTAVELPVLRKDFAVSEADVVDARLMGADAVLLIVAALDDQELRDFHALAVELQLAPLVEAHDEAEVDRALGAGARLIGVNQRDLVSFAVDPDRAKRVARAIPPEVTSVAESGIRGPDDARALADAGFDAVLVGEHLVTSGDPAATLAALVRACS